MANKEVKPFHFDLTETLYFHRNEGVSEMLGIGSDPEITIESHPDHVSVRGIIALTGEYLPEFVTDQTRIMREISVLCLIFEVYARNSKFMLDIRGICANEHKSTSPVRS